MSQRRYKAGIDRQQELLFPPCVDDYINEENPVRAIDAYVDSLDLHVLGFEYAQFYAGKGQPPYAPATLLKLYLYGYLNRLRSSRCLERETWRNLEVIWLIEEQHPRHTTIADFRKNNTQALRAAHRDFILLC